MRLPTKLYIFAMVAAISLVSASSAHCSIYNETPGPGNLFYGIYQSWWIPTMQDGYTVRFESPFIPPPMGIIDPINFQQFQAVVVEPPPVSGVPEPATKVTGGIVILFAVLVFLWRREQRR